jgi:mannose-6-phosphate isomerase-like protein (cupin superfamily)
MFAKKRMMMEKIVSKENGEHYVWGGDCDGWHLLKAPNVSVIQERVPPGRSERPHCHRNSQQFFYVLAGVATLEVGGDVIRLNVGEGVSVAPQVNHVLRNEGNLDVEFLLISVPPSHGDRVLTDDGEQQGGGYSPPAARPSKPTP